MLRCKTDDHANRGGERHGDKEANEAEQIAKRRNCEHHLNRTEVDALRNEVGSQDIVCNPLGHDEDSQHDRNQRPARPELEYDHDLRHHEPCQHPEIENETNETSSKADQDSMVKTSQPQCQRIIKGKDEADRSLPAKESRDRLIELAASVLTVSRCAAGIERSIAAIKCFQPLSK